METSEVKPASGYGKPPWIFKGSALYQLHLVKAEKARACIPKEFRLVEAFGYTLGGFFLASYEDSPAGSFDELVVIAGLVWNRPTSCAIVLNGIKYFDASGLSKWQFVEWTEVRWATRVYVNSDEACDHGRKEVGLPSHVASFSKRLTPTSRQPRSRKSRFLNMIGIESTFSDPEDDMNVQVTEIKCPNATSMFNISLISTAMPALNFEQWKGPAIRMSLPSFSGGTQYNPNLLKYSCQIECRVQAVKPLKVTRYDDGEKNFLEDHGSNRQTSVEDLKDEIENFSSSVMLAKPILALKFSDMRMQVEAPVVLSQSSRPVENSVSTIP